MKTMLVKSAIAAIVGGALSFAAVAVPTRQATVTVSGYDGTTELTNFPVLVRISTDKLSGFSYNDCAADGADISFVDADGAALAHEIDTWNAEGESTIWVKVPLLTNDVAFVMRWRDDAPPSATASDAWNSDYVGVWHMGEESGTCANSTSHGSKYDATPTGDTSVSTLYDGDDAPIGGARTTATTAAASHLVVPSYDDENVGSNFTFSAWMRIPQARDNWDRIFSRKSAGKDANGWEVEFGNGDTTLNIRGSSSTHAQFAFKADKSSIAEQWLHLSFAYNGDKNTVGFYCNGSLRGTGNSIAAVIDNGRQFTIGNGSENRCFRGAFDECRLKKGTASADWVKAEYDTVASSSFVVFGNVKITSGMMIMLR